ncbi:MAG TPA: hypothetical protein VLI04_13805 [Nocardioidaceae bacterium]|nr:hypothetical protein [Nocardioidaceae bacterium]
MQGEGDLIKEMIRESELDPAEYAGVAEALASMRALVPEQAPVPSAELAALISGGVVAPLAPPQGRRHRAVVVSGVTAALLLGGGVAAANNKLPDALQRFVHDVSEKVTPWEFPEPGAKSDGPHQLPEPARNDVDQGKHVGVGDGGGKTGNLGQNTEPPKPTPPTPDKAKPTDLPTPPVETPGRVEPVKPTPTPGGKPDGVGGGQDKPAPDKGSSGKSTDAKGSTKSKG